METPHETLVRTVQEYARATPAFRQGAMHQVEIAALHYAAHRLTGLTE